jgi:hypothetical protein
MPNNICKIAWLVLCGSAMQAATSPPVIGTATSWGAFLVNNASVPGSATLFEGASLQTDGAASTLQLYKGERLLLSSHSAAVIHNDNLLLDRGIAEFSGLGDYRVQARDLSVRASGPGALIRVGVGLQNRVMVASVRGAAEVRNRQGTLVARLASGAALTLSPTSAEAVDVTGIVLMQEGKFYLVDDVTKVKVELRANGLSKVVGKRMHITGTVGPTEALATGVSLVVIVDTATAVAVAAGATAAAGAATAAGASAAGISTATIAIVGGAVAVGGTVGGLAATGVIGSSSSVSR